MRRMYKTAIFVIFVLGIAAGFVFKYKTHILDFIYKKEALETMAVSEPPVEESCQEKETLTMAKACTYLIGNAESHGTGFAISEDGTVITNYHVIEYSRDGYADIFFDGKFHKAPIIGFSIDDDLAVIDGPSELYHCDWTNSNDMELAETVFAVGWPNSPYGESTITKGIVSRYTSLDGNVEAIQTDTPINPGNSGGPLINKCGVVGINTSKVAWIDESAPSEGIGYAITSNYAKKKVEEIVQKSQGEPIIPSTKINAITITRIPSQQVEEIKEPLSSDTVNYDYEQVIFWEQRKIQDGAVLDSWEKTEKKSAPIDENSLEDLISTLKSSLNISETLWDGYTNSKITYEEVYNLKQKYLENSSKTSRLTKELNIEGSINAYKSCIDAWDDLEKEYDEDFSKQREECEKLIDFD